MFSFSAYVPDEELIEVNFVFVGRFNLLPNGDHEENIRVTSLDLDVMQQHHESERMVIITTPAGYRYRGSMHDVGMSWMLTPAISR